MEAGAAIINVPQVEERHEAEEVVKAAKYHPQGERGYCASSRGTKYGFGGQTKDIFAAANERVMTMVQVESLRGVENASEICSVRGLDIVFIGLADLSQSMGLTGQIDHPDLIDRARRVVRASRANGKIAAMLVDSPDAAKTWLEEGVGMLCCGVDIPTVGKTFLRLRKEFNRF